MNYEPAMIIALIVALTEILKGFKLPAKWCPLVSVVLGVAASFLFAYEGSITPVILQGLMYGLSAAGLYDLGLKPVKTTLKKVGNNNK